MPSEITDRVIAEIANKLRISGGVDTGLALSGITRDEYSTWELRVRAGSADPITERLVAAVQEAEHEVKMMREHQLAKYFDKNWQALAWWLERKYPDEYASRKPKAPVVEEENGFESLERYMTKK